MRNTTDVLQLGMVHSIEPVIYIPGFGGIRIEDDILDLEDGGESLSKYEKELPLMVR